MKIIIEGIDRLGKDTLIKNIVENNGFHFEIHYSKPKKMAIYGNDLYVYQRASFQAGFELLLAQDVPVILNRFHLGECTYAPLYRGYSGDYVFKMEKEYCVDKLNDVKLILLTTSDFSFIEDDGDGFDFSKKEEEQRMFIDAFNKSIIRDKVIIDVSNGDGGFKNEKDILLEALR